MRTWLRRPVGTGAILLLTAVTATVTAGLTGWAGASPAQAATPGVPNFSPTSRTVSPSRIYDSYGQVTDPLNVIAHRATRLTGANSAVVLDFGKEVGGLVTLSFGATSNASQQVGLAFSESSLNVGLTSDASSGGNPDGALTAAVSANGTYTMPTARLRGGFRYLTVFLKTDGWAELTGASLNFTAAPGKSDPSAYANYFSSNDPLLNKIWYGGAYTVQLGTIASNQGRAWPPPASEWDNSAIVSTAGTSVLTDAAKRDRTVWSGDLGVSLPAQYASTDDLISTRNALTTLYDIQAASGELPYAGPPWTNMPSSDTYHLWALLGTSTYYQYSGDKAWLDQIWAKYKAGMAHIRGKVDANNLLNVTGTADWARSNQGGENIQANAVMYATLLGGVNLATAEGDSALVTSLSSSAAALKTAANQRLWDASAGLYRDNPTEKSLYPQDGNSLAVWYGLTDSAAKNTSISGKLAGRWNSLGAITPEWNGNVHPFAGGMEVAAHFAANDDDVALDQIRRTWGYMLNSPIGTKSTMWEGISAGGGLAYGGSFMSLAHGWSTGPTAWLTYDVLGLKPGANAGQYDFVPHPGDLTNVEGRITLPQGAVNANWQHNADTGNYTAHLVSPAGSTGRIGVPKAGGNAVKVSVNGATVWDNGQFTARPGITGASQDANYVYLSGVSAGTYDVTATGTGKAATPTTSSTLAYELPAGYTRCADEAGTCTFSGTRQVAYGAGGSFAYKTKTASTPCTNAAFGGDADPDMVKSCYVAATGGPSGYTQCAAEDGSCAVPDHARTVAYGANGSFTYKVLSGNVACNNATFGDPVTNTVKNCYLGPAGAPSADWTKCSGEGQTCATVPGQPVAYGARGAFTYLVADGNTACSTATFGKDPIFGEAKDCYTRTGNPPTLGTVCAAEKGTCAVTGGQQVIGYGARGAYVYKTVSGDTPCTTKAFGADPLPDVVKSCYRL